MFLPTPIVGTSIEWVKAASERDTEERVGADSEEKTQSTARQEIVKTAPEGNRRRECKSR